ncbi:mobilization protein MbpA [Gillisia sp. Q332]|uniref:mobilization protein MbpA n=1 Tax=Gillisia xinjiangensis TaxID=3384765 RepID=UPI00391BAC5C
MKNKEILREQKAKNHLEIPVKVLMDRDSISMDELQVRLPEDPALFADQIARCVSVDTKTAPGGRKKKEVFKAKRELVKFRCSVYEKKLLQVKAKRSGLSLSEYCRQVAGEKDIKERLSDEHWEIYKSLMKFHNNFKSIGNMFRKKDPRLSKAVYTLADEINIHLQKINK